MKQFKVLESFTNPNLRFLFGAVPGLGLGLGSYLGSCLGSSGSNHSKSYLPLEFFIEDFLERYAFPIPCSVNPNALAASEKVLKITGDENFSLFSDVFLKGEFRAQYRLGSNERA